MISLECASFTYDDGVQALGRISLTVGAGEQLTIVGASGSGKTTMARLLVGQTGADMGARFSGSLTLRGHRLNFAGEEDDPRIDPAVWSAHVGYVAQNSWAQLSMMSATVAEEIAFGPANRGMPVDQMREVVRRTAEKLKLTELLDRDPRRLSGGQLQKTIIAAAVADAPEVLILDEPFHGLDPQASEDVETVLAGLRAGGTAVVSCDPLLPGGGDGRVVVLSRGRVVFDGSLSDAPADGGNPCVGVGVGWDAGRRVVPLAAEAATVLELRGVRFAYPHRTDTHGSGPHSSGPAPGLTDVNLTVRQGEAVALTGANGSGKSTLLQNLNGLLRPDAGSVTVQGRQISGRVTGELAATVGFLFQNTDQQLFERTVLREVTYGPAAAGVSRSEARRRAVEALKQVGLESVADRHPHELGFSQRRFVALASMLATGPAVWALDEPTAGLDAGGRKLMKRLIRRHLAGGGVVVMATHDICFAEAVCHRRVTLADGRILDDVPTEN